MDNTGSIPGFIHSTAGAIPVKNVKGEVSMKKVKVQRYVSGKRPDYAAQVDSDEESDEEFGLENVQRSRASMQDNNLKEDYSNAKDSRLRRLNQRNKGEDKEERIQRHRHIHEPEILAAGEEEENSEAQSDMEIDDDDQEAARGDMEESSEDEDLDEDEIEKRRALIRMKARERQDEELLAGEEEEEKSESEESGDSSEYEEYTESEEEDTGPRLKPVFVRKRDRITVHELEKEKEKQKECEIEAKHAQEDRKRASVKMVEQEARKEIMEENNITNEADVVITDDENDEVEYEAWKVRELKRVKRDRDEREKWEKDKMDLDRLRNMTEEERRADQRVNPKVIVNKSVKGKYKFLQKYYHRGAFYLENDEGVFKRDFAEPTLEDHFDKTILPKVMQVKNFGRSGRTKYTHLVDNDTTQFDSAWTGDMAQKFHSNKGGGTKQQFDRPSTKRKQ